MTANTYLIDAKKQQDIYTQLRDVASQHQDDDVIVGVKESAKPDSLSETDVIETTHLLGDEKARITVMDQARFVNVFVSRAEALRVIYDALRARDADQNGKIDTAYLTKDLSVTVSEESSAVTDASWERLVEKYKKSIFAVRVYRGDVDKHSGQGTGFIYKRIEKQNGAGYTYHVLTNAHVAAQKYNKESAFELYDVEDKKIRVKNVKFVGADINADVAVLEFDSPALLEECPLSTRAPRLNETVMEIGNTEGEGVIAIPGTIVDSNFGMARYDYTDYDNYPFQIYKMFIHTRGGNSGSPVFNADGEVMLQHHAGEGSGSSPYNYGIPNDRLKKSYENITTHRDSGGVTYSDWGIYPAALDLPDRKLLLANNLGGQGVKINKVYPDSPAANSKLKAGDIILSVNGKPDPVNVSDEMGMHQFLTTVLESTPGKTVKLEVYREKEGRISFDLVPEEILLKQPEVYESSEFNAVELTRDKRRLWNLPSEIHGVWIHIINRNQYGDPIHPIHGFLYEGNIITAVNGEPTPDIATFQESLETSDRMGLSIKLTIYSGPSAYHNDLGGVGSSYDVYLAL